MLQLQGTAGAPIQGVNAIQITIQSTASSDTILYTVPVGRKFVGYISSANSNGDIKINNMTVYSSLSTANSRWPSILHTLLPGTVVREGNFPSTTRIIGVESDA
jgi:hypothetical protein